MAFNDAPGGGCALNRPSLCSALELRHTKRGDACRFIRSNLDVFPFPQGLQGRSDVAASIGIEPNVENIPIERTEIFEIGQCLALKVGVTGLGNCRVVE